MRIINNKKIILYFSILLIVSFSILIPATIGYGSSVYNAEQKTNGTYNETLLSDDNSAYYKVFCNPGDDLTVTLTVNYPTYNLDLILYNQTYDSVDTSFLYADVDTVSDIVEESGAYYIIVLRYDPPTGNVPFELVISGATGTGGIPGFEIISLLVVIISTISVIYLRIRRNK